MSYSAEVIDYKGKEAIELTAGKYKAVVAPFLGSNVLRMQDVENDIEIFRYDESLSIEDLKKSPEVYGLPTLYLPNRLAGGVLKVSDATYHVPLNDPLGNHIHGFLRESIRSSAWQSKENLLLRRQNMSTIRTMSSSRHIRSASRQSLHLPCLMMAWIMHLR